MENVVRFPGKGILLNKVADQNPLILKLVSAIFYELFIFHQTIALQKLWKMFFISSKKLVLETFKFLYFRLPLFFSVSHCFRGWFKINFKVYGIINCLNKNLITHFVWYLGKEKKYDVKTSSIDRVLNKEHFNGKITQIPFEFWWITQNSHCMHEIL